MNSPAEEPLARSKEGVGARPGPLRRDFGRDLMHRWEGNPLITIEDLPFQAADICNAGAARVAERYLLLLTIEGLSGRKAIYPAWSGDGYHFTIAKVPVLARATAGPFAEYEADGVLDARVVLLEGRYYLTYQALSRHGYVMALARTDDFERIERLALLSEPDCKSGALFPEKIGGRYAMLERPGEGGSIWVAHSDDLVYWGEREVVMTPRSGFWDTTRIGPAAPPLAVDEGWLCVYYGVKGTSAGPLYRLGAAVLDRGNPARVLGRTNVPILAPREEYERIGDQPNIIFSCGAVLQTNRTLRLYYGGSDSCICLSTAKVRRIVECCLQPDREF